MIYFWLLLPSVTVISFTFISITYLLTLFMFAIQSGYLKGRNWECRYLTLMRSYCHDPSILQFPLLTRFWYTALGSLSVKNF